MKKILAFAVILGAMLSGCSNNDDDPQNDKGTAFGIASASLESVITKSSTPLTTDGATLGVYRLALNGYAAASNVEYYYDASLATPAWVIRNTSSMIYLNNNQATVCAYNPYHAAFTDPAAIPVAPVAYSTENDLTVSGHVTVNNANNQAGFTDMQHVFSSITFTISKDETYSGTGAVSNIKIGSSQTLTGATLDVTVSPYTLSSPVQGEVSIVQSIASITTGTPVDTRILMVPVSTLDQAMTLIFTVDGVDLETTITPGGANFTDFTALTAGTNYKIGVMIKGTGLVVSSVSITDWTDQPVVTPLEPEPTL